MHMSDNTVDTVASSVFALAPEQGGCGHTLEAGGCRSAWRIGL